MHSRISLVEVAFYKAGIRSPLSKQNIMLYEAPSEGEEEAFYWFHVKIKMKNIMLVEYCHHIGCRVRQHIGSYVP
jgi:hypothetical protein